MTQKSTIDKVFQRADIALSLSGASKEAHELTKVNDRFCAMTGYPREECVGRNCSFLQGDDRDQPGRREMREALDLQRDTEVVLRNYTRDGKAFDNLVFLHHIRDVHGKVVYILGSQFVVADRPDVQALDHHLHAVDVGLTSLAESHRTVRHTVKRQLSGTVSVMLHTAVLRERMSIWLDR